MTQNDQNTLSMWRAVRQHLDGYNSIWKDNIPFSSASTVLTESINKARSALDEQAENSKGFTNNREALERDAIRQVVAIGRSAKVYALDTGNEELLNAVDYSRGALHNYPQNELAARLRSMVRAAMPHNEALKYYGVAADAYNAALEAIGETEEAQSSVRTSISGKKAVTETIPDIISTGRLALVKLDHLIHLFELQQPDFASGYKTARKIIHAGTRHKEDDAEAA